MDGKYDIKMDGKMTQNKDNSNNKNNENPANLLSYVFDNEYVDIKLSARVDNTVPTHEKKTGYFRVTLHGLTVEQCLNVDMAVAIQSGLRPAFDSQDSLNEFMEKHCTENKPFRVHFHDMRKRGAYETPEMKKQRMIREMKRLGFKPDDLK